MSPSPDARERCLVAAGVCLLLVVGAAAAPGLGDGTGTEAVDETKTGTGAEIGTGTGAVLSSPVSSISMLPATVAPVAVASHRPATRSANGSTAVSEERYVQAVPEPGDEYFEAAADDGSWVSYDNPRDRYRDPMAGNASGKVCVTLRNEAGEVVVGESVPNTTVSIPTPSLYWHSYADPMVVEFPLTEHYERPLDADQFGTSPDLPQGDGYLDSHCIEFHGPPDDATIEYGEAVVDGEHADDVEVVGYVQQARQAWETDVDAFADAVPYEATGGNWTMRTGQSHGEVVVVLQLDGVENRSGVATHESDSDATASRAADETPTPDGTATADETPAGDGTETRDASTTLNVTTTANGIGSVERDDGDGSSPVALDQPARGAGTTAIALVFALSLTVLVRRRRQ